MDDAVEENELTSSGVVDARVTVWSMGEYRDLRSPHGEIDVSSPAAARWRLAAPSFG